MKDFEVDYLQRVHVSLKEEAFTDEFYDEFCGNFFYYDTLEEHAKHISQLYAREIFTDLKDFVEGYGIIGEFVKDITIVYTEEELV